MIGGEAAIRGDAELGLCNEMQHLVGLDETAASGLLVKKEKPAVEAATAVRAVDAGLPLAKRRGSRAGVTA